MCVGPGGPGSGVPGAHLTDFVGEIERDRLTGLGPVICLSYRLGDALGILVDSRRCALCLSCRYFCKLSAILSVSALAVSSSSLNCFIVWSCRSLISHDSRMRRSLISYSCRVASFNCLFNSS